jgi:hypothetical protein
MARCGFAFDIDRRRPLAEAATVAGAICAERDALELPYLLEFYADPLDDRRVLTVRCHGAEALRTAS